MAAKKPKSSSRDRMVGKRIGTATIIRAKNVPAVRRTCLVGGEAADAGGDAVPTIMLEKDADGNIARIVVRCPCGRTAELICAYE